jgi:hypothetical protein
VGDRVNVNWVSGAAPGLNLLGDFLGVRRCKDTSSASVTERVGQEVKEMRYSVRKADRCEHAKAKEWVST